jgi:transketolase
MANAARFLSVDMVNRANSGHPGAPMGMADFVTVLFKDFFHYNPSEPDWPNRDRFVLSNGHASALLYSVLHLTGQELSLSDLKGFRQLESKTAGHPEYTEAKGIETTTGPLGQGIATAVGMALAQKIQAARLGKDVFDNKTYVTVGDGCLMEGISHEAAELAGKLGLNNLIVLFDSNKICIDGKVADVSDTDVAARFKAYGFKTLEADGHDHDEIYNVLDLAQKSTEPVFITFHTRIGYGSSKADTASAHGSPLGEEGADEARKKLGWKHPEFVIPQEIYDAWEKTAEKGVKKYNAWEKAYKALPREKRKTLECNTADAIKALDALKEKAVVEALGEATRKTSGNCFDIMTPHLPQLVSGSADLTGSNNTITEDMRPITTTAYAGQYLHYGVREHAMGAVMNGLALYGGIIPAGGTFLVFSDYMRTSIRLSALMQQQVIYVLTHDSIGLGEDGPTHQPIEHLAMLRATPNLHVFRPADQIETAECWQLALQNKTTPTVMALSRQGTPTVRSTHVKENLTAKGAYVLKDMDNFTGIFIATGSEVALALEAQTELAKQGIATRVVSMPCQELFDAQPANYQEEVLPSNILTRVAIEAASELGWHKYIGLNGTFIGMRGFGGSAPASDLYRHFGITASAAKEAMSEQITQNKVAV